jgi:hypothetical protein
MEYPIEERNENLFLRKKLIVYTLNIPKLIKPGDDKSPK